MSSAGSIYENLGFPEAPLVRPYVYIDMVATIDGKTVSGNRGDDVMDLGSEVDHALMRRIQDQSDVAMVGATTLRAASAVWDPKTAFRVVVSNSGQFDYRRPFFSSGGRAFVACSESSRFEVDNGVQRLEAGKYQVDFRSLLARLHEMGARHLLCFGGQRVECPNVESRFSGRTLPYCLTQGEAWPRLANLCGGLPAPSRAPVEL